MVDGLGGITNLGSQGSGLTPAGNGQQDNSAAALGTASKVMGLIANKNVPSKMKLELWNTKVVQSLGKIMGDGLPEFSEWPEELNDYAKRADGILKEKSFGSEDKMKALKSLMESAEEDINLAPGIESFKALKQEQNDEETFQILRIMLSDDEPSDDDISTFTQIKERNPRAAVDAAEMIDNERRQGNA